MPGLHDEAEGADFCMCVRVCVSEMCVCFMWGHHSLNLFTSQSDVETARQATAVFSTE